MCERNVKSGSWKSLAIALACLVLAQANWGCSAMKKGDGSTRGVQDASASINGVAVEKGEGSDRVIVTASPETIPYSVFKWEDPLRVVVDFKGAQMGEVQSTIPVADQFLQDVEVKPIEPEAEGSQPGVRMIANLEKDLDYEVTKKDGNLVVEFRPLSGSEKVDDLFEIGGGDLTVESGTDVAASEAASDGEWAWSPISSAAAEPARDAAPASSDLGKKLMDIDVVQENDRARVDLMMDGRVGDYSAFTLDKPDRLVVDLWGIKNANKLAKKSIESQGIGEVRVGEHADKLRLVFDAKGEIPSFRLDKDGQKLSVTFSESLDVASAGDVSTVAVTETSPGQASDSPETVSPAAADWPVMDVAQNDEWGGPTMEPAPPGEGVEISRDKQKKVRIKTDNPSPMGPGSGVDWGPGIQSGFQKEGDSKVGVTYIDSVKFEYTNEASTIVIHADRPIRREKWVREDNPEEKIVTLFISNAQVQADQNKSYDTTEFVSPIELFSVFQSPDQPNEVAVVVVMRGWAASKWNTFDNKLSLSFENYPGSLGLGGAPESGLFGPRGEIATGGQGMGGVPSAGDVMGPTGVQYTGPPISLDFKNMDILDALRTIADVSGMNIVVSDEVKGKITIKLDNVPWDQALDLILETKGLGKVEKGNIIRVANKETLEKEIEAEILAREREQKYEKLETRIVPINYLAANDMVKIIKPVLTPKRGSAQADKRTNSLLIIDIPSQVEEAIKLVSALDRPTKQVLIEARIVEATVGVSREIGVSWGTNINASPSTGYPTGLNFPGNVSIGGATLGGAGAAAANTGVNSSGGGALGLTVGSISGVANLDVMLRALEAQEKIHIVSSPRILTLSDEEAVIEQGVSIPYPPPATLTGQSQGWTFVEAALELTVTPHVAADNSITMEIRAANNEPISLPDADAPGISRKQAETVIMLKDGETAVIGGIFKLKESNPSLQVPYLGNLPVVGWMFRDEITETRNEELIIFLTPQIIHPGGSMVGDAVAGG